MAPVTLLEARRLPIRSRLDVDQARREARRLAASFGFNRADAETVALAASELAMNLQRYAVDGEIEIRIVEEGARRGLVLTSGDHGPGIDDPARALEDGYSTGGSLGSGLPAVRRLMDDFDLETAPSGTRIVARKWLSTGSSSR
jgi:serine/threonine-protein kinase RsbT